MLVEYEEYERLVEVGLGRWRDVDGRLGTCGLEFEMRSENWRAPCSSVLVRGQSVGATKATDGQRGLSGQDVS